MLRFSGKVRATLSVVVPAALLAVGLIAGPLRSAEWSWRTPILAEVESLTSLAPVRALPRTEAVLATFEAQGRLAEGRPWEASESLRPHLDFDGVMGPAVNLLAAEAALRWRGWRGVRTVRADRDWRAAARAGRGRFRLARAAEELGSTSAASAAYRQYVRLSAAREKGVANARLASLLRARGQHAAAAAAYEAAA